MVPPNGAAAQVPEDERCPLAADRTQRQFDGTGVPTVVNGERRHGVLTKK